MYIHIQLLNRINVLTRKSDASLCLVLISRKPAIVCITRERFEERSFFCFRFNIKIEKKSKKESVSRDKQTNKCDYKVACLYIWVTLSF